MKNRTVPYGYKYENGIIILHPQESEIVKRICMAYLEGKSLLDIATMLNEQKVEYMPEVIGWNKARLKRIIEDERYLGKEPYPAILDEMTYTAMQRVKESRNTQKDTNRKTDIFQITRMRNGRFQRADHSDIYRRSQNQTVTARLLKTM